MRFLPLTKDNTTLTVCTALNYGGRQEIVEACKEVSKKVKNGKLNPEQIDISTIANHLYTVGLPDPELLIRTSCEYRISNFLLWQIAYAEIYYTDRLWPDFDRIDLLEAVYDFQQRERRFGGLGSI